MAFPNPNTTPGATLGLKHVCDAYSVAYDMNNLRGVTYYDSAGVTYNAPGTGVIFPLAGTFGGKYRLNPSPLLNQPVTSTPIPLPVGRPTPTQFNITLTGGNGGGGGGGGAYIAYGGGGGGAGGSGAIVSTGNITYDAGLFAALTITFPTAGGTGNWSANGGGGEGHSIGPPYGQGGGNGVAGQSAVLTYNSVTYTAGGGAGGAGGGGGAYSEGGPGAPGAGGTASPSGTNGATGGGGAGGGPGFPDGNNGNAGTAGTAGSVSISWYFT